MKTLGRLKEPTYLSTEGLRKLQDRLEELRARRRAARERVAELRQIGNVESFALVDEMQRLYFIEKEMAEVQRVIGQAQLLQVDAKDGTVQVGAVVQLRMDDRREVRCMVVNSLEADPSQGKISDRSPLGRALLGKMANALVRVDGPRRSLRYQILRVDYAA